MVNVGIELVSKWEICWALWTLVVFDPVDDPTRNNVAWFLMGDFLRLNPWNRGLGPQAHCESCARDLENVVLVIRVCCCSF